MTGLPIPTPSDFVGIPPIDSMPSFTMADTTRFIRMTGGWITSKKKCYMNIKWKVNFSLSATENIITAGMNSRYDMHVRSYSHAGAPVPKDNVILLPCTIMKGNVCYMGLIQVYYDGNYQGAEMAIVSPIACSATDNAYVYLRGEYDI